MENGTFVMKESHLIIDKTENMIDTQIDIDIKQTVFDVK